MIELRRAEYPYDKKPYNEEEVSRRPHDFDNLEEKAIITAEKEPLFDSESEEIMKNFLTEFEDKNGTRRHLIRLG